MCNHNLSAVSAAFESAAANCVYTSVAPDLSLSFKLPDGYTREAFLDAMFARKGRVPEDVLTRLNDYAQHMAMLYYDTQPFCEKLAFAEADNALECFAVDAHGPCGMVSARASFNFPEEGEDSATVSVSIDLGSVYVSQDCRGNGLMGNLVDMIGAQLGVGFEAAFAELLPGVPVDMFVHGEIHSISGYKYAESFMTELGIVLGFPLEEEAVNVWSLSSAVVDGRLISIWPDIGD